MTNTSSSMEVADASHDSYTHIVASDKSKQTRKLLFKTAFAVLALLVLVLLIVVIHLSVTCGRADPEPEKMVRRPLLPWRSRNQCPPSPPTSPRGPPPLLVISLDGFRPDYMSRGVTPMLQDMLDCGVTAPYVRTAFPSKTFPNHYSIVTGMYPESNGIVGNTMYDPELPGRKFKISRPEALKPEWWIGEPVWETVKKMGDVSAVFFWVGSEVPGHLPNHYRKYDKSVPFEKRVAQIVDWLLLPEGKRPRYLSLYFNEPDSQGHNYGPDSEQVNSAVEEVDTQLANLYNQLIKHNLLGCVDIVVTSDHGMAAVRDDCESVILDDYVPELSENALYVHGPAARVRPNNESTVDELVDRLDCAHPALRVFHRSELPERWHYQKSRRIEPMLALVDQGYGLSVPSSDFCIRGMHGYDNDLPDMRSFFVGHGPSFKQNYTSAPFENIQLYSLFQTLLGLPDIENNATKHSLDHLLVAPPSNLTVLGPAPAPPSNIPSRLENLCFSQLEKCSEEALSRWPIGSGNGSGTLPLPLSDKQMDLIATSDGTFVAEVSELPTFRWLQYSIDRDDNNNSLSPAMSEKDRQCLFKLRGSQTKGDDSCAVKSNYRSLVHTEDTVTYWGRMAGTMYPMYPEYQQRVLPELERRLKEYAAQYSQLVVLAGPVYRTEARDGYGHPIPSHFFYQLRMCGGRGCPVEEVKYKQWILPHKMNYRSCEAADKYLDFHEATLRDVERVSGLTLFSGQVVSQPDSAHLGHARFITQLPEFQPPQTWAAAPTSGR